MAQATSQRYASVQVHGQAALYHNGASQIHHLMHSSLMQCDVVFVTRGSHDWALCLNKSQQRWSCCAAAAVSTAEHMQWCCCCCAACLYTPVTTAATAAAAAAAADIKFFKGVHQRCFSPAQTSLYKPTVAEVHQANAAFRSTSITRMEDVPLQKKWVLGCSIYIMIGGFRATPVRAYVIKCRFHQQRAKQPLRLLPA